MGVDRGGWVGRIALLALLASACGSAAGTAAHGSPSSSTSPVGSPVATPTPSGAPASPSGAPSPVGGIAANLVCRLAVISPASGGEPPGGWVTFPGGVFVRDPASLSIRLDPHVPSYDRAIGAWVPVEVPNVAPDGASYVLHEGDTFNLVDAKTGNRRLILSQVGPGGGSQWQVVQYASEGIYLWTGDAGMAPTVPGLWLLDQHTGSVRLVDGSHYWGMVGSGAAWALDEAGTRAIASKVHRLDLGTGQVSTLYDSKSAIRLLSPTPDGEMLIDYGETGSPRLALLTVSGTFVPVELPPAFPPIFSASQAPQGVWLAVYGSAWSGIALYVKGEGVTVMANSNYPLVAAGGCA